ncbi:hypothetical protein [Pseudomonas chlororaphis]|uniref:hypothetical protein n=1 Tax=Pseudomonas chlororaphis TaxID=587753 RepID=UPI001B340E84|nr:hypothetical protein [Pseudomonas chlororaphis]
MPYTSSRHPSCHTGLRRWLLLSLLAGALPVAAADMPQPGQEALRLQQQQQRDLQQLQLEQRQRQLQLL